MEIPFGNVGLGRTIRLRDGDLLESACGSVMDMSHGRAHSDEIGATPIEGMRNLGPFTLTGILEPQIDEPGPTIRFRRDSLPRRAKKTLKKVAAGRPLGRREQTRSITIRHYEVSN